MDSKIRITGFYEITRDGEILLRHHNTLNKKLRCGIFNFLTNKGAPFTINKLKIGDDNNIPATDSDSDLNNPIGIYDVSCDTIIDENTELISFTAIVEPTGELIGKTIKEVGVFAGSSMASHIILPNDKSIALTDKNIIIKWKLKIILN